MKGLKPLYFAKPPSWMYEWVLNTLLEEFVQDGPRKELAITPVEKYLITTTWQNYH